MTNIATTPPGVQRRDTIEYGDHVYDVEHDGEIDEYFFTDDNGEDVSVALDDDGEFYVPCPRDYDEEDGL